ncbi:uncharacterized protein LOC127848926 [Dreissena polymorpha]|uniref:Uncharacterized protein n=1 Tax=Dreissena polymorpha TaxID=45954 RepID=A0A9D4I3E5_DREPO|nr:uncharacterized protein LOC127848926 [Dreissena polymorpha]KAH3748751.1 hypothetical protein DPMN_183201 [Dreissena polymorpha]
MFVRRCSALVLCVIFSGIQSYSDPFGSKEKWTRLIKYAADSGARAIHAETGHDEQTSTTRLRTPRDLAAAPYVVGSPAPCVNPRGWNMRGTEWGCCGNYDGCCTYASLICLFHDAACRCCAGKELCGPKCKPDSDCHPPKPWPWENLQQIADTSHIQQTSSTKTSIQTKEMTLNEPNDNSDNSQKLYSEAPHNKKEVTSDLPEILQDVYLENTTPFADYMNDEYDDYGLNATSESEKDNSEKSLASDTDFKTEDEIFASKIQTDFQQNDEFKDKEHVEKSDGDHQNQHNQIFPISDYDTKPKDINGTRFAETDIVTSPIETFENVGNDDMTLHNRDQVDNMTSDTADMQVNGASASETTDDSSIEQSEANIDSKVISNTPVEEYVLDEYEQNKAIDKYGNKTSDDSHIGNKDSKTNHTYLNENEAIDEKIEPISPSSYLLQPPPPLPPPPLPVKILKAGNIGVYLNSDPDRKTDENKNIQTVTHSEVNEESESKSQSEFQINEETNPDVKVESGNWLDETLVYSENINDARYANNSDSDLFGAGMSRKEFEGISEKDTLSKGNNTNVKSKTTGQIADVTSDGRLAQIDREGGHAVDTSTILTPVLNSANNDTSTGADDENSHLNNTRGSEAEAAALEKTEGHLEEEGTGAYENTSVEENQQHEDEKKRNDTVNANSDVRGVFHGHKNAHDKTGEDNANQAQGDIIETKYIANETNGVDKSTEDYGEIIREQENTQDQIDESKFHLNTTATDDAAEDNSNLQETTIDTIDGGNAYLNEDEIKYRQETQKGQTEYESSHLDFEEITHGKETAEGEAYEDKAHLDVEEIKNTLEQAYKSDYIPAEYFNDLVMDKELFYVATEVLGLEDKTDRKYDLS